MDVTRKGKLQTGITISMVLLVTLVVLIMSITSMTSSYRSTQESIREVIDSASYSNSASLDNYLSGLMQNVESFAVSGAFTSLDLSDEDKNDALARVLDTRDDMMSFYLVNSNGIALNDANLNDIGENYSNEPFFVGGMAAQGAYIDPPMFDEWSNNITMSVSYHLHERGFNGLLVMDIKYDVLKNVIIQEKLGKTGYCFILDAEGNFVAHPDEQVVLDGINIFNDYLDNKHEIEFFEKALASQDTVKDTIKYKGYNVKIQSTRMESVDWILVSLLKPAEFYGEFHRQLISSIILALICIVVAIVLAMLLSRRIAKPVTIIADRMELLADGDIHTPVKEIKANNEIGKLNVSITKMIENLSTYVNDIDYKLEAIAAGDMSSKEIVEYKGDFTTIGNSLERIRSSMNSVLSNIIRTADSVNQTAQEMAVASEELSRNSVSQAGTIDEIDTNFGKISNNMDETADGVRDMLEKTNNAKAGLTISSENMRSMINSMGEIEDAASSVSDIIRAIDDIAFQTNILALNAAVEAARAGQHGRGFSVVADEVRNLASKSAGSASETGELIGAALDAVKRGTDSAEQSKVQIGNMEHIISDVNELVAKMEKMAHQQADAVKEIYQGINLLNSVVQSDSAMSEESATASQILSKLAHDLESELEYFQLEDD